MALKSDNITYLLADIVRWREHYSYLPQGNPSDWKTGKLLNSDWMGLLDASNRQPSDDAHRSQALVRELERRYVGAATIEQKTEAVWLARCWKTQRRMEKFKNMYAGDAGKLASIWEKSTKVAEGSALLETVRGDEIGIAVASTFAAFASRSRSLGVLDRVIAKVWRDKHWVPFKLRHNDSYLEPSPTNWRLYSEYIRDLQQLAEAATSLRFIDASTGQSCAFSLRDIEMALYKRFVKSGSR